jgi:hypothetical protein
MKNDNTEEIALILNDILLFTDYKQSSDKVKIEVISNLLLLLSKDLLPDQFQSSADSVLSNTREITSLLLKHPKELSFQLALKAHIIQGISNNI